MQGSSRTRGGVISGPRKKACLQPLVGEGGLHVARNTTLNKDLLRADVHLGPHSAPTWWYYLAPKLAMRTVSSAAPNNSRHGGLSIGMMRNIMQQLGLSSSECLFTAFCKVPRYKGIIDNGHDIYSGQGSKSNQARQVK